MSRISSINQIIGYIEELIIADNPKPIMAESFRSVRTSLKYFAAENEQKVILITKNLNIQIMKFMMLTYFGQKFFQTQK